MKILLSIGKGGSVAKKPMCIADSKKLESICIVPTTLKELRKEQQALEMRKKERFCKT
jgi:hypothetical protein